MPWRMAPAWPESPPPVTVATTSYWPRRLVTPKRLGDHHPQHGPGEIDGAFAAVDRDLAVARLDPDAGDGVLAPAGGIGAALRVDLRLASLGGQLSAPGAGSAQILQVGQGLGWSVLMPRQSSCSCGSSRRRRASPAAGPRGDARARHRPAGGASARAPGARAGTIRSTALMIARSGMRPAGSGAIVRSLMPPG